MSAIAPNTVTTAAAIASTPMTASLPFLAVPVLLPPLELDEELVPFEEPTAIGVEL
jgi:hypothetical protein